MEPASWKEVFVSAGEASGDRYAAQVVEGLRSRLPRVRFSGLGGPELARAGVELVARAEDVAVVGAWEVLEKVPRLLRLLRRLRRAWADDPPNLLLLVDFPGFNLRLARAGRAAGVPVLYYVSPQIWAWRPGRRFRIARDVSCLAAVFPFEPSMYKGTGLPVVYVGHPLLEDGTPVEPREPFCRRHGLDPARPYLLLLPGSRAGEVERLFPLFLETAVRLRRRRPDLQTVVAATAGLLDKRGPREGVTVVRDETRNLLAHAAVALSKSGTISLEAALMGTPHVIGYRVAPLTYWAGRLLVQVPFLGLPNLILGKEVVPEFIQGRLRPAAVAPMLEELLDPAGRRRQTMLSGFREVRAHLGGLGASGRVTDLALALLNGGEGGLEWLRLVGGAGGED